MTNRDVNAWNWIPVLLVLSVGFFLVGCGSSSSITTPNKDNPGNTKGQDPGMFRGLFWDVNDDELIADVADVNEANVDISNVVYSHSYAGSKGRIKKHDIIGDYAYVVETWQERGDDIADVYFRLYYYDPDAPEEGASSIYTIPRPDGDRHSYPAVTASYYGGKIYVDVVFQKKPDGVDTHIQIWHARFEETAHESHAFTQIGTNQIVSDAEYEENCMAPDIVYDAAVYSDDVSLDNKLHIVYTRVFEYWHRDIEYVRGVFATPGVVPDFEDPENLTWWADEYNNRARIDIGFDDSGVVPSPPFDEPPNCYLIGVVWHHVIPDEFLIEHKVDVMVMAIEAATEDPPTGFFPIMLSEPEYEYNYYVFPFIEIDPIGLQVPYEEGYSETYRITHIVWTHTVYNQLRRNIL